MYCLKSNTLTKDLPFHTYDTLTTSKGMEIIHYWGGNKHEETTDGDTEMCQTQCMISDMTTVAPHTHTHTYTHKKA